MWVQIVQVSPALLGCIYRVHWWQVCRLFGTSGPAKRLSLVLWSCVPSFCPLSRFVFGALLANMALFRVLRAFLARFVGFRVGLCCLGALRGLCGFCTRVELGGLKACCVFASIFPLLCLSFYLFTCFLSFILSALFWLSFFVLLHCLCGSLGVVVVSFSLSDYTQKERARRVGASSLCVSCVFKFS